MAHIKMTPEEVRMYSKAYDEASQEVFDMLRRLETTQERLAQIWEGDAFEAFQEQYYAMKPTVEKFGNLMEDVYQQLQKIAKIVEDTDKIISSVVRKGF